MLSWRSALCAEGSFTELAMILQGRDAYDLYEELTEAEQQVWCIYTLVTGVGQGGFQSYFWETEGRYVKDTIDLLATMELDMAADVLRRAARVNDRDFDDEDKSDLFLDLSDEFIDLDDWYEYACGWCVDGVDDWLSADRHASRW